MHHPSPHLLERLLFTLVILIGIGDTLTAQLARTTPYSLGNVSVVPESGFGQQFIGIGDLNANGSDDVVMGIPGSSVLAMSAGAVEARDGLTGALLWRVDGTNAIEGYGVSLARIDDVNGDQVDDVAVGRRAAGPIIGAPIAQVDLLSGIDGSLVIQLTPPQPLPAVFPPHALTQVSDMNNDGVRDLALTSSPMGLTPNLEVSIFDPVTGTSLMSATVALNGPLTLSDIPTMISGEDLTGDGIDDLILGRPHAATIVFGLTSVGEVIALDGSNLSVLWHAAGFQQGQQLGTSLEWLRDVTGDGIRDLIVGAPQPLLGAPGAVHFRDASDGTLLSILEPPSLDGVFSFGASIANVTSPAALVPPQPTERIFIGCDGGVLVPGQPRIVGYEVTLPNSPFIASRLHSQSSIAGRGVVRRIGDVNGDGQVDGGVGIPGANAANGGVVEVFRGRGAGAYGSGPAAAHTLTLMGLGADFILSLSTSGAAPGSDGLLIASLGQAQTPAFGGTLLVDTTPGTFGLIATHFNAGGSQITTLIPIAFEPAVSGYSAFFQAFEVNPAAPSGIFMSDGLQVTF